MLERVISGGQTGVDQAALRAATAAGIPTGGTAPKGWATEEGPAPWLADFGLVECTEPGYPPRTIANVRDSDGTLWIGDPSSPGGRLTIGTARELDRPLLVIEAGETTPADVRRWLLEADVRVLNVAGNRESTEPGSGRSRHDAREVDWSTATRRCAAASLRSVQKSSVAEQSRPQSAPATYVCCQKSTVRTVFHVK